MYKEVTKKHGGRAWSFLINRHVLMRLSILWTAVCMHVCVFAAAQRITLKKQQASLPSIIKEINQQTGYYFLYDVDALRNTPKLNVDVKDASLKETLDLCFQSLPLAYVIKGKSVIISKRKTANVTQEKQEGITGKVTNENGDPIDGATVRAKGGSVVVTTGADGIYALHKLPDGASLIFSYIGFETKEIQPTGSVLNVILKQAVSSLNEAVVIGYGQVDRRDLTGSVGSVNVKDMQEAPVRSFEEALAGRVAGVQVTSQDGQPGSGIDIVIRGANSITQANSPLYVIDGFPIEDADNNALNPDEIESIEILKDASATAIYGSRGANGVIIITTKGGHAGRSVINYKGGYAQQDLLQRMEVLDPYEFVRYMQERSPSTTERLYLSDDRTVEDYKNIKGVDWQDLMFRSAGMHNHTLSISGGNEATKYLISGSALKQDGVIIQSGYDRYQARLRLDQSVSDRFKVGLNANYSTMKKFGNTPIPGGSETHYSSALMFSVLGYRPVSGNPDVNLEDEDVDDDIDLINDGRFNPVTNYLNSIREQQTNVLTANAYAEYLWNGFKLRFTGGATYQQRRNEVFNTSKSRLGSPLTPAGANGPNGSVTYHDNVSLLNENTLTYTKKVGDHRFNAVGGFTAQTRRISSHGARAVQLPNEALGISGLNQGVPYAITASSSYATLASFLGRVNYNYKWKYLATASFRADGSSKFPPGNKWGYFPSGALSWRFSREPFMKPLRFISDGKLRVSTGVTGNNRVSDFAYMSTLTLPITSIYPFNNSVGGNVAIPNVLGNSALLWESTMQTDLGLDLGLFDDKVTLVVDLYRKTTDDLLLNARIPSSLGFSNTYKNIGKVRNEGLEISVNTMNVKKGSFSWESNFNIAFNRNKVLSLTQNQEVMLTTLGWAYDYRNLPLYVAQLNRPIAQFYGLLWDGNYQYNDFDQLSSGQYMLKTSIPTNGNPRESIRPGDIKYQDLNGDGVVDLNDYTIIGNPNPDFFGGLGNNFSYKGISLHVFMQWSYGNQIYNANRLIFEGGGRAQQNVFTTYLNRWTPENQNNEHFRAGGQGPYAYSDRVVEDGAFLRLKTVSLGYTFSSAFLQRLKLQSLRLLVSAQNLYTWSNYQGFDPEVSSRNSALTPAFDYSVYPRSRTINFGINLSL